MDHAERLVALRDVVHYDAEGHDVVDIVEVVGLALLHFFVDRVEMFGAAGDGGLDAVLAEVLLNILDHLIDVLFTFALLLGDQLRELIVNFGLEVAEAKVFELGLHPVNPEPARERRIDVERLLRDQLALFLGKVVQRAHVVRAVGELNEDHAKVFGHGHNHLAEVLRLLFLGGAERDPRNLGHAVHELGHGFAKLLADLLEGGVGIFHGIVQDSGDDGVEIKVKLGEDGGDRNRMHDVWFARAAALVAVLGVGEFDRLPHERQVYVRVILEQLDLEILNRFLYRRIAKQSPLPFPRSRIAC